jgi:hypothetical protein
LERDFDAQKFKPFTVIALDKKQLVEFNFDGKSTSINLNVIDEPFMRSSSSWRAKEVITFRENLFELWLKNQNYSHNMPDFNLPNGNEDEYWTPFVKREKVHTKNICHVELKNDYVDFKYYPFEQIIKNNKILSCEHLNLKINN